MMNFNTLFDDSNDEMKESQFFRKPTTKNSNSNYLLANRIASRVVDSDSIRAIDNYPIRELEVVVNGWNYACTHSRMGLCENDEIDIRDFIVSSFSKLIQVLSIQSKRFLCILEKFIDINGLNSKPFSSIRRHTRRNFYKLVRKCEQHSNKLRPTGRTIEVVSDLL